MRDYNRKYNAERTPEYRAWSNMKQRCNSSSYIGAKNYQDRNIKVCDRWNKFENFLSDVGTRPSSEHSIDRINNDGNYEPGNVKWSTRVEQMANTRVSVKSNSIYPNVRRVYKKFQVALTINGHKNIWIGSYGDLEEALSALLGAKAYYNLDW